MAENDQPPQPLTPFERRGRESDENILTIDLLATSIDIPYSVIYGFAIGLVLGLVLLFVLVWFNFPRPVVEWIAGDAIATSIAGASSSAPAPNADTSMAGKEGGASESGEVQGRATVETENEVREVQVDQTQVVEEIKIVEVEQTVIVTVQVLKEVEVLVPQFVTPTPMTLSAPVVLTDSIHTAFREIGEYLQTQDSSVVSNLWIGDGRVDIFATADLILQGFSSISQVEWNVDDIQVQDVEDEFNVYKVEVSSILSFEGSFGCGGQWYHQEISIPFVGWLRVNIEPELIQIVNWVDNRSLSINGYVCSSVAP
jgi:hypothetical protein